MTAHNKEIGLRNK